MHDFDEVRRRLPLLSSSELERVKNAINALLQLGGVRESSDDTDERRVLGIICKVLERKGVEFTNPNMLLKSINGLAAFRSKLGGVMKFTDIGDTRSAQDSLLSLGINLLYEDLVSMGMVVSSRMLINQIHRVPAVLNKHFPGYAKAKMLDWVIRQKG